MTDPSNRTNTFYDAVADDYHLWYRDWETAIEREGLQLRRWLRERGVKRVVDASCGPGTQSIALAQLGYEVTAADPSAGMLERARRYAEQYGVADKITFVQASFHELSRLLDSEGYDALLTKGSAFPHLITDEEIEAALISFHKVLRPGGTVVVGMQDFEPFIEDRPRFIPGRVHDGELNEPQVITFDIWDWDDGPPLTVTINSFIVSGAKTDYQIVKRPVICRALTATEVQVALLEAGFEGIESIRDRLELVMLARKPE
ncbi:MAG: class I SAM-dependent methyltransferase [Anaerolineales bacterium]|nr:class I SAM-dependent methyltransferase [Anaerolineales bacterium]